MEVLKHVTLDGVRVHLNTRERKLWINSKWCLFLNETSCFIVESLIDCANSIKKAEVPICVVKKIVREYDTTEEIAEQDFATIVGAINAFARDEPPLNMVGVEVVPDENLTAPNRMDLSLTYRCNNKCGHCYLPKNESNEELTISQWKQIIDKLWDIGIPQVVFTGGEPFIKKDTLIKLAEYSKKFICGIITNGTLITDDIAKELKRVELDWIQITLESGHERIHDKMIGRKGAFTETSRGISNCVKYGVPVSINATLTKDNYQSLNELLDYALKLGVRNVSTNAIISAGRGTKAKKEYGVPEKELAKVLKKAKKYAEKLGIELNWFLPTCYKNLNPMELGFGQRCCSACQVNMMVEPDGKVIPCQSWTQEKLGNILTDEWESIWSSKISKKIRNYGFTPKECTGCEYLDYCHGSCPLSHLNGGGICG